MLNMPCLMGLGLPTPPGEQKNVKFFVCVCLSTCYALEQQSLSEKMTSPSTHWNLEMVLISLDGERFSKGKADG